MAMLCLPNPPPAVVYGLRINNVNEPHSTSRCSRRSSPTRRCGRNVFAYIDARDLGHMVQRCLDTDGLGYQVFNVANADMSVAATTQEIQDRFYDKVEVRREMGRDETFYAIDKSRDLLGYEPRHSWCDALIDPRGGARLSPWAPAAPRASGPCVEAPDCWSGRTCANVGS
jgi:nucleoside-diphosphate-sugar epimerase